jgi:hypothetical protein
MSLDWILLGFRILAAIILYTFLGLAFYIIWRDLRQAAIKRGGQAQVGHRLRVIEAVDNGLVEVGQAFSLQPLTFLGRDPENTIIVRHASVSARHARLSRENGVWWLEDLGSRNGTTLNDLPLSKPTPLTNGDIIGIGSLRFKLETAAE